ncbi:MAG: hypothetical protein RR203_02580 [Synergistaceae bacterium]
MRITLENISAYIAIITFAVGILKVFVMGPLKESLVELRISIEKLNERFLMAEEKQDALRERVVAVEASAKQAHKRIDEIRGEI